MAPVGGPLLYVTFSGERNKGGARPIDNVVAYAPDGSVAVPAVLRPHHEHPLHILRGMAIGPDGHLYVANAHRKHSMLLAFGPPAADGTRAMVGDRPVARHDHDDVALVHPYGLVWDRHDHLLVSVQDTVVVTRFTPDHRVGPVAPFLQEAFGHIDFLPGTHVAGAVAADHLPPPVPVELGGLLRPRGVAYCPERHVLYVADEGTRAVRSYDADTGHFLGDILTDAPHKGEPVGLLLDGEVLYVGLKRANRVLTVDLASGAVDTAVHRHDGGLDLVHPAGLARGADGWLYVASQGTRQLLRYDLEGGRAEVFVDELTDSPEHLLLVP